MNYKLSHYLVASEEINQKKSRILFSTRSCRTIKVSKHCYDTLIEGAFDRIPAGLIQRLTDVKVLVPAEEDELQIVVSENKQAIADEWNGALYEVIQPSAMCQLGCYYCGQNHTKNYLNHDHYDKILQRITMKARMGNFTYFYIGWFGAEPLMGLRQMRELTPMLKKLAASYGMGYGAKVVTNGLSLKENVFEELVNDLAVNHIEVTLDGTAPFHDQHRYTKEGGKSFDLILQNLTNILNKPNFADYKCQITIRCNVDEKNCEGVSPLIKLLAQHNLQRKVASFYPIGVYSWGNDAHKKSLTKEDFAQRELDWMLEMMQSDFPKSTFIPDRVRRVCFAVSKISELYDAEGNIWDCSEVSYVPTYEGTDYKLGNLSTQATDTLTRSHLNDWNDTVLTDKHPCHTCTMLPVCGGACPKSWSEGIRACPPNKFNIKDKLLMQYVLGVATKEESLERYAELKTVQPQLGWLPKMEALFANVEPGLLNYSDE